MLNTVRAALSAVLLLGFYVYAFGMVVAFGALTFLLADRFPTAIVGKLGFLTLFLAGTVLYATWKVLRAKPKPLPGLILPPEAAPRMWNEVRGIAAQVGTRPPDEIRLIAEVNA